MKSSIIPPILLMYAIINHIYVSRAGCLARILPHELGIQIANKKIQLKAVTNELFYTFKCHSDFLASVSVNGRTISRVIHFQETKVNLIYSFDNTFIELSITLTHSSWSVLDSSIDSFGAYKGQAYYVEDSTLETSYENVFTLQKQFPLFLKLQSHQSIVYVDIINKIVIKSSPIIRKYCILRKLSRFLASNIPQRHVFASEKILIDRTCLIENALAYFLPAMKIQSVYHIKIAFLDEMGEDQGALKREFLYLLFNKLVADLRVDKSSDIYDVKADVDCPEFDYFYTNRSDQVGILDDILKDDSSDTAKYFVLLGATVASLFLLSETLQCNFSLLFYESLLSRKFTIRHIQDVELQRHIGTVDSTKYISECLFKPRQNQYDHVKFGFDFVLDSTNSSTSISKKLPDFFCAFDFPFIFHHLDPINTDVLRNKVCYVNCSSTTKEIIWLWRELSNKDQHFLSKFLLFITGSGNPTNSINEWMFTIEKVNTNNEMFRASACVKRLYISGFDSQESLSKSLDISVLNAEGFHFI
ncbi:uncharacterized protein VICG_01361 [Vittaforma corneae ATCC 50505]|uniref:HECT-type E3 ubiquitin transferase n=1 Tax=Vittaforma corneae (strain ATCC 50505) TaxID=993615 RepID=L2GL71_VITCO|nr:uncharacterized protein VICG_01361 [Vittaforma corneae ATCC 50505]ELA41613.1 hypothetical protein VICG_01361 [Vittaforma corneae ATCC 50505]